ncbi:hypothetical protein E2C01_030856 [Portunus trituberculatus]|uniref:Uncharacterized protein n=1 Tax=Portunus trituberculatus TaxID=210409 RepID=A0A5B7ES49_PORTR|nr:hypothetical protein [Portunus trituberculatus]
MIDVPEDLLTLASSVSCGKNEVMKDHSQIDLAVKGTWRSVRGRQREDHSVFGLASSEPKERPPRGQLTPDSEYEMRVLFEPGFRHAAGYDRMLRRPALPWYAVTGTCPRHVPTLLARAHLLIKLFLFNFKSSTPFGPFSGWKGARL